MQEGSVVRSGSGDGSFGSVNFGSRVFSALCNRDEASRNFIDVIQHAGLHIR